MDESRRRLNRAAARHLKRSDPVLAGIIERVGPCRLDPEQRPDVFHAVVRSIIYQQLNGTAAGTIYRRFKGLYPGKTFPPPKEILATGDGALRATGISPQKMSYLRDLSLKVLDGTVDLRAVRNLEDEEVIEELTKVKGVGRWTAEMVLIFTLGRPDVLPADDYGFRRSLQMNYSMRKLPSPERIKKLAEPWRPYRSIGTWYVWQSLATEA